MERAAAWGEFVPTLEEVLNIIDLPLYGETNTICLTIVGEDKDRLQRLTAMPSSTKSSYS